MELKNSQRRNLLFTSTVSNCFMNSHRPRMSRHVIEEIKTYHHRKLSIKNKLGLNLTTISVPVIIRTIPPRKQLLVLAALHAQPLLLGPHQYLHQLVTPNLYHQVPLLPIQDPRHLTAMVLLALQEQPLCDLLHLYPNLPTSFEESRGHPRSLPSSPSTPSSVRSKPWFREVIDNAISTLQTGEAAVASTAAPQRNIRSSTLECKAQPL